MSKLNPILILILTSALAVLAAYIYTLLTTQPSMNATLKQSQAIVSNIARNMSTSTFTSTSTLPHAKIVHRPSSTRGHADHGWLNTYHSFSFASWYDPRYEGFGSLRVLNEDRVAPQNGFPTHPHRDFEIFSYVVSGELTHRDSIKGKGGKGASKDDFFVMKRDDVQFTTGGTGIAHSEQNENPTSWVHFLQIWVKPWARSLPPTYHTSTFPTPVKRQRFVPIISPLTGGPGATAEQEKAAKPLIEGTIPIHADFFMGAGVIPVGERFGWKVGGGVAGKKEGRRVYVHLTTAKGGKSRVVVDGREGVVLGEGDGAFVSGVGDGDELVFESVGSEEAEVVVLDSD